MNSFLEGKIMVSEIAAAHGTPQVVSALKRASASTGAGFDFLMKMAVRESSLDPSAKAGTSSAAGLFQFIEQTWLGAVKQYGDKHGLADFSSDIDRNASGRFVVADAARQDEILNLRFDADMASAMAGELSNTNASYIQSKIGRAASSADLYTAHFLGPAGAVKLLSAAANTKAADILPQAARANTNVFYDGARAKTVGEVIGSIAQTMDAAAKAQNIAPPSEQSGRPENISRSQRRFAFQSPNPVKMPTTAATFSSSRFATMAYSIMQALDPLNLASGRDDNSTNKR